MVILWVYPIRISVPKKHPGWQNPIVVRLVYLDLLIVQIVSGRMNWTGLFLDHPYRVTQLWYFSRRVWDCFHSLFVTVRRNKVVGNFELGILKPQFYSRMPCREGQGKPTRDLMEVPGLATVEAAGDIYLPRGMGRESAIKTQREEM